MPSGRIVNYTYNAAARPITAIDANGAQYVSNVTHWPSGDEYQRWMPNIYFNTTLNNRLQISGLYSDNGQTASYYMNKTYSYGTQNNGNVASIVNNKDPNRTATYTYDALNRITSGWSTANTGALSWGENYTIDAWGNLMIAPMGGKAHGGNFQCAGDYSNRATCLSYDPAGNVTANGSATYTYDQENRLSSTAGTTYVYDGNGSRVKKSSGSTGTLYWYALPGIIAETNLTGALKSEYVFFEGKRIARIDSPGNSVHYYLSDHLNSTTMVVSSSGTNEEESDYSPFGSEYQVTSNGANHYKFTGKERDSESQLDYFVARYYFSISARFMSADPAIKSADARDPQTWHGYSYVTNNPLKYNDPTGKARNPVTNQEGLNPHTAYNTSGRINGIPGKPHKGEFGMVRNEGTKPHRGVDIQSPVGAAVHAPEGGTVTRVTGSAKDTCDTCFGLTVYVKTDSGYTVQLSHLSTVANDVKSGSHVDAGETIAASGKSGNAHNVSAEEEHVHVQVTDASGKEINPVDYFNDPKTKSDPLLSNNNPPANACNNNRCDNHPEPPPKKKE